MSNYLLTIVGGTLLVAVLTLLAPNAALAGRIRMICSLFLICVLLSPIQHLLTKIGEWTSHAGNAPWEDATGSLSEELLQNTLDEASKAYVQQILCERLEDTFSIPSGDLRCEILWKKGEDGELPQQVTVFLTGNGIWKDTRAIEAYVSELLNCTCSTVLE